MSKREFLDYHERSLRLFRLFNSFEVLAEKDHVIDLPTPQACEGLIDYQILDLVFDSMDLDYVFRFGHLLVARPEDLWPFPAPDKGKPDPDLLRHHLGRLESAVLGDLDDAERAIRGMGTWVLDTLRAHARGGSAEFQARIRKLVSTIEGRSTSPRFRPECAMDAQLLTAAGEAIRARLKALRVSMALGAFAGNRLDVALLRAEDLKGVGDLNMTRTVPTIKCSDFLADLLLDRRIESSGQPETSLRDVLVLVTRLAPDRDLELCVVDGKEPHVRIDTREEIAKIVAAQNAARESER